MTEPTDSTASTAPTSGNRWEPAGPPPAPPVPPVPPVPPSTAERRRFPRPGRPVWVAGIVAALVFVGAGGFAAGRASVDDHARPFQVDQLRHPDGLSPGAPGQGTPPGVPGVPDDDGGTSDDGQLG